MLIIQVHIPDDFRNVAIPWSNRHNKLHFITQLFKVFLLLQILSTCMLIESLIHSSRHRFVRSEDRKANKDTYPHLDYPEIYLLDQGYKKFFECHQGLCTPQEYMTMLDKNHEEDLRHFRIKSKSWAGDSKNKGKGRINFRSLKF